MKYVLSLLVGLLSFVSVSHALMAPPMMRLGEPMQATPEGCLIWNDGCNDCEVEINRLMCPPKNCANDRMGYCRVWEAGMEKEVSDKFEAPVRGLLSEPELKRAEGEAAARRAPELYEQKPEAVKLEIPLNCTTWYDGCNTCGIENGKTTYCTEMACLSNRAEPKCTAFVDSDKQEEPRPEPVVIDTRLPDVDIVRPGAPAEVLPIMENAEIVEPKPSFWGFIKHHLFGWFK